MWKKARLVTKEIRVFQSLNEGLPDVIIFRQHASVIKVAFDRQNN